MPGARPFGVRPVRLGLGLAVALLLAGVGGLVCAPFASAAHLITWTTPSRYVDPSRVTFNSPPPGVPPRPAALRVDVLLPDGYDGQRRFPVLYLLHGHGDSYDSWVNPSRGNVLDIARGLSAIVVMPEAATGWYTNWWDGGARGSDGRAWESYHLDELIPLVESRLRVLPGRANHAIVGNSMGGEGAIYYAEQRPGYFGAAGSFSGVLSIQRPEWPTGFDTQGQSHTDVYGDPQAQSFYWTGHNPTALVENLRDTRIFVTVGDGTPNPSSPAEVRNYFGQVAERELRMHAQDFVAAAQGAGVDVTYQPRQGIHDWPYWRQHLMAALGWGLFKPVAEAPSSWRYSTVSQSGRAWDLRFTFDEPPGGVETFVRNGSTLTALGTGDVTIQPDGAAPFTATLPFTRTLTPLPRGAAGGGPGRVGPCSARRRRSARRPRPARRRHHRARRRGCARAKRGRRSALAILLNSPRGRSSVG
ncbi:MAG TPA: alpha/beta hydrolase family protein [Solirubrobacteraceae bacterium]|nr:alpha/beta hydrolase family protein [Solirubrobacteraceae bacterium]